MKIGIIDADIGNIQSLYYCIKKIGHDPIVSSKPSELINMEKLIFPGVGAFDAIYENVKKKNLLELFNKIVVLNKPLLGICVGFQLLAESSIENKVSPGLKIIKGNIRPIKEFCKNLSVPHVGWNSCKIINKNNLFDGIENNSDFYFTHSYYLVSKENKCISTLTNYGDDFISSVKINKIYGVQFHPEKSQKNGLTLIKNFIEKC